MGDRILAALAVLPWAFWNKRLSSTVPLAALAVWPRSLWNKWLSSTICFNKTEPKQLAWQGFCPPNLTWRPLPCLLNQSFFYDLNTSRGLQGPLREQQRGSSRWEKLKNIYHTLILGPAVLSLVLLVWIFTNIECVAGGQNPCRAFQPFVSKRPRQNS